MGTHVQLLGTVFSIGFSATVIAWAWSNHRESPDGKRAMDVTSSTSAQSDKEATESDPASDQIDRTSTHNALRFEMSPIVATAAPMVPLSSPDGALVEGEPDKLAVDIQDPTSAGEAHVLTVSKDRSKEHLMTPGQSSLLDAIQRGLVLTMRNDPSDSIMKVQLQRILQARSRNQPLTYAEANHLIHLVTYPSARQCYVNSDVGFPRKSELSTEPSLQAPYIQESVERLSTNSLDSVPHFRLSVQEDHTASEYRTSNWNSLSSIPAVSPSATVESPTPTQTAPTETLVDEDSWSTAALCGNTPTVYPMNYSRTMPELGGKLPRHDPRWLLMERRRKRSVKRIASGERRVIAGSEIADESNLGKLSRIFSGREGRALVVDSTSDPTQGLLFTKMIMRVNPRPFSVISSQTWRTSTSYLGEGMVNVASSVIRGFRWIRNKVTKAYPPEGSPPGERFNE